MILLSLFHLSLDEDAGRQKLWFSDPEWAAKPLNPIKGPGHFYFLYASISPSRMGMIEVIQSGDVVIWWVKARMASVVGW